MWDSVQDFENRWNRLAGVHTIMFGKDEAPVDIYVNEHVDSDTHRVQPVFFTGAVSQRDNKKGPFFSGLGITNGQKLPLIAIADPSLDDDVTLSLGWYAGGPADNFVANLVRLFDAIQRSLMRELLLIGGSGGGFAALNVGRHLDGLYSVLVWNPQTDIYEYSERFVKLFLKSRFNFSHESLSRPDWKDFCRIRTDSKISTNVLMPETIKNSRRFVYLQNSGDWHRAKHLAPLWNLLSEVEAQGGLNIIDPNHVVFIKDFADGHAPPSAKLIASLIGQLMNEMKTVEQLNFEQE